MTGSQTDAVSTARYVIAVSILLRLGSPLFRASLETGDLDYFEQLFDTWLELRRLAEILLREKTTQLGSTDEAMLESALTFTHEHHHRTLAAGYRLADPLLCHCLIMREIRELTIVRDLEKVIA